MTPDDLDVPRPIKKFNALFECVVEEREGDVVWCTAHPLGNVKQFEGDVEFWEIEVPGNEWEEGHVFYLVQRM